MPFSVQAKNAMLDHLATIIDELSVHSSNPGSTGAAEISGPTRQVPTWGTAALGALAQTNTVTFGSVPSGTAVNFIGMWASGVWYGYQAVTSVVATGGPWSYVANPGTLDLNAVASA